jgi:tetratricopeptide (TPR) repeat protein
MVNDMTRLVNAVVHRQRGLVKMAKEPHFSRPGNLFDYLEGLVGRNSKDVLKEKPPLGHSDIQDQIRSAIDFMRMFEYQKQRGDYWHALRYLMEDLRYYSSIGDAGKYGHVLLETADCLFSCGELDASMACCSEAIILLVRSRHQYEWAMEVAATGELLLAAVSLNAHGYKETVLSLRKVSAPMEPKERRALTVEDAHKIARRLVAAYRIESDEPLRQLGEIQPRRKRTEGKNLCSLLIEWKNHYRALRTAVETIAPGIGRGLERPQT